MIDAESLSRISWSRLWDNLVNNQLEWNFIHDERNAWNIDYLSRWLWRQISKNVSIQKRFAQSRTNRMQWNRDEANEYTNQIVTFREKLLVLMHIIEDQLARASKILSVRHCNTTREQHRNIFVKNELMMFVIRTHKEYNMQSDVKIIHRYLSREIEIMLMYYLLLMLSFQQRLKLIVWKKKNVSTFLWSIDSQKRQFTFERMRKCLKEKSEIEMRVRLTIQSYREISIAISRRWVRKQNAFRRNENDEDENWNENDDDRIANEQVDHTFHVTRMIYAREIMKQNEVVKSKRDKYREFSKSWHEFLRFLSSIEDEQKFS